MMTSLERHRELCLFSSFISEQGKWLDSVLGQLKWSKDSLQSGCDIVQCPHNVHHYVPPESLEAHKTSCFYATKRVSVASLDQSCPLVVRKDTLYQDKYVPSIEIDASTERAVKMTALDPELYQERGTNKPQLSPDGVEDCVPSGLDVASLTPHQVISYIKSWRKVPLDWSSVVPSSLDLSQLKGWLYQNIPREHAHSGLVGGEIVVVDTILQSLTQEAPSVTPNAMVDRLKSLLRANASSFVLSLWKHLHMSRTLERGGLAGGVVEDIAPMHLTQLLTLQRGAPQTGEEETPLVYKKIKELMGGVSPHSDHTPPLPMDAVFYSSSPIERRVTYDYVVGAGQVKAPKKKKKIDPDLYRNDEAVLKAKLKALAQQEQGEGGQESRSCHELLRERKEKRDYKRRRQKYRAKNVHITRRKTSEIFHDIINNRMEEIAETLRPQLKNSSNLDTTEQIAQTMQHSDTEDAHSVEKSQRTKHEDEQRPSSRRKRHLSRSKSRSRSRERRHSHKKHKKHKSHKHSSSREHRD